MNEALDSFVFYRSFRESIKSLKTKDQLVTLLAICDYALYGVEPNLSGIPLAIFTVAKPNIDANNKRRENGKRGGRPKKETKCFEKENHRFSDKKPNENEDEDENGNGDENENGTGNEDGESKADKPPVKSRFVPPTVEQVAKYVKERGSRVDPQSFVDFYAAKGWLIGKSSMKDWKAACRNAEKWDCWSKAPDTRNAVKTAADYDREDDFLSTP